MPHVLHVGQVTYTFPMCYTWERWLKRSPCVTRGQNCSFKSYSIGPTLAIFFYIRYRWPPSRSRYSLESSDQHRHRESGNQDKPHRQIVMQLRYRSSHWIAQWVVSVFVIIIEELDCPWFTIEWSLHITYDVNHAK